MYRNLISNATLKLKIYSFNHQFKVFNHDLKHQKIFGHMGLSIYQVIVGSKWSSIGGILAEPLLPICIRLALFEIKWFFILYSWVVTNSVYLGRDPMFLCTTCAQSFLFPLVKVNGKMVPQKVDEAAHLYQYSQLVVNQPYHYPHHKMKRIKKLTKNKRTRSSLRSVKKKWNTWHKTTNHDLLHSLCMY